MVMIHTIKYQNPSLYSELVSLAEQLPNYKELARNFGEDLEIYYAVLKTETFVITSRRNYEKEFHQTYFSPLRSLHARCSFCIMWRRSNRVRDRIKDRNSVRI